MRRIMIMLYDMCCSIISAGRSAAMQNRPVYVKLCNIEYRVGSRRAALLYHIVQAITMKVDTIWDCYRKDCYGDGGGNGKPVLSSDRCFLLLVRRIIHVVYNDIVNGKVRLANWLRSDGQLYEMYVDMRKLNEARLAMYILHWYIQDYVRNTNMWVLLGNDMRYMEAV